MDREEVLFVWNLFDAFQNLGIEKIPADIVLHKGAVGDFGELMRDEFPQEYNKIKSIFAKSYLSGEYGNFREILEELPHFHIRHPFDGYLYVNKQKTEMPEEMYLNLARKFCEIAEIEI